MTKRENNETQGNTPASYFAKSLLFRPLLLWPFFLFSLIRLILHLTHLIDCVSVSTSAATPLPFALLQLGSCSASRPDSVHSPAARLLAAAHRHNRGPAMHTVPSQVSLARHWPDDLMQDSEAVVV